MKFFIILLLFISCNSKEELRNEGIKNPETILEHRLIATTEAQYTINPQGKTIQTRFPVPDGFKRTEVEPKSFQNYLRILPLKPHGSEVKYFNGGNKSNNNIYAAVIDLPIGKKDLHQCADAIMRLKAEYLWKNNRFDEIHFNFTNGMQVDYSEWMEGKRIVVNGNRTNWEQRTGPSNSYDDFWKYMETIFMYAGTLSLSKELEKKEWEHLDIGDILIQGGSPGHAVIVVDMVKNNDTGERRFLLAQSYMPAQEIHILQNPRDPNLSSWYSDNFDGDLVSPEWNFNKSDLMTFKSN